MKLQLKDIDTNIFRLIRDNENYIDFCPDRGGLITNWTSNGKNILYFDECRFLDKNLSIRGGIPILFPICGNINQNLSIFGSKYLQLKQHGFARDLKWQFQLMQDTGCLNLYLKDIDLTRKYYPFSFEIKMAIKIEFNCLIFEIEINNKSNKKMPVNFGLHPYFNISDFQNIKFEDYPLVCLDQKSDRLQLTHDFLRELPKGIDLLMYSSGSLSFTDIGFERKITLINPYPFDLSVVWTDPPRKMICMEPWTSPRNSLVNGLRKILIPPNSSKILNASIIIKKFEK